VAACCRTQLLIRLTFENSKERAGEVEVEVEVEVKVEVEVEVEDPEEKLPVGSSKKIGNFYQD
jgi:hypothetical protein